MRPAPALALVCAPSLAWRLAGTALGAAAAAAVVAWLAGHLAAAHDLPGWAEAAATLATLAAAAAGAFAGRRAAAAHGGAELRFDGHAWSVDGVPGDLQLMLDFDRWLLLLRHRPREGGRSRWLAVAFARGEPGLAAVRTALQATRPDGAAAGRVGPSAEAAR